MFGIETTKNQFSHLSSFFLKLTLLHSTFLRSIQTSRRYMQKKRKIYMLYIKIKQRSNIYGSATWTECISVTGSFFVIGNFVDRIQYSKCLKCGKIEKLEKNNNCLILLIFYGLFFFPFRSLIFCLSTFPFGFEYGKIDLYLIL